MSNASGASASVPAVPTPTPSAAAVSVPAVPSHSPSPTPLAPTTDASSDDLPAAAAASTTAAEAAATSTTAAAESEATSTTAAAPAADNAEAAARSATPDVPAPHTPALPPPVAAPDTACIKFFVNGRDQGVAFDNIKPGALLCLCSCAIGFVSSRWPFGALNTGACLIFFALKFVTFLSSFVDLMISTVLVCMPVHASTVVLRVCVCVRQRRTSQQLACTWAPL